MYSEIQYYFFDDVYSIQGQANRPLDRSMGYTFDFSVVWDNLGLFLSGAIVTVRLSLIAIAFGLAIGIIGALCRISGNRLLNGLAATYFEIYFTIG